MPIGVGGLHTLVYLPQSIAVCGLPTHQCITRASHLRVPQHSNLRLHTAQCTLHNARANASTNANGDRRGSLPWMADLPPLTSAACSCPTTVRARRHIAQG